MEDLQRLAELAGISSSYIDKMGNTHETSDATRRFFLSAMGYSVEPEDMEKQIAVLQKSPVLPEVMSFFDNEKIEIEIKQAGQFTLEIEDEKKQIIRRQNVRGYEKIILSELPTGYYMLRAQNERETHKCLLIYAPEYAYMPDFILKHEHITGTTVMLYGLRSEHNMGIGDFGDLAEIIRLTAQNGGDAVGINPLGVMSPFMQNEERLKDFRAPITDDLSDVSPYRSLSRLFVNYAYLDLRQVEEFTSDEVQRFVALPPIQAEIEALRATQLVEYARVLQLKQRILSLMYEAFKQQASAERKQEFDDYCLEKGADLDNTALFEVLLEVAAPVDYWQYWPQNLSDINSAETKRIRAQYADRIDFYKYCHWLGEIQVKAVQQLAVSLGMKIGLYGDMPIGAASNGVEVWQNPEVYALEAGIGAPADLMRPKGQNWGFTPYHPAKLKRRHYQPFINLVRANMQNFGALRIDHAMGLRRLFWGFYTADNPVVQGAYIYYDIKDLTAILTLESVRAKCLLIGEDLGTVPEGFREYMAAHGLLSYKTLARQKEKDGSFIAPEKYIYMSLAQFSTHDQATACGFWNNADIEVFEHCHLYVTEQQYVDNLEGRHQDRINLYKALKNAGLTTPQDDTELEQSLKTGEPLPKRIHLLCNQFVATTNSAFYLMRLCDVYRQTVMDNAPGTVKEHPNWRHKLPISVEQIKATSDFAAAMQEVKRYRPKV